MKTSVITQSMFSGTRKDGKLIEVGEFVPTARATATFLPKDELESPSRLGQLYSMRDQLARSVAEALPVERTFINTCETTMRRVEKRIAWHERAAIFDMPTIDLSFLRWRTKSGFPAFSVFSVEQEELVISVEVESVVSDRVMTPLTDAIRRRGSRMNAATFITNNADVLGQWSNEPVILKSNPVFPEIIAREYLSKELAHALYWVCQDRGFSKMDIIARYGGNIPEQVREKIQYWRARRGMGEDSFDHILIVAEAPDESWSVRGVAKPKPTDPIVIGICRAGIAWVIDVYDLTAAEQAVRELCVSASNRHIAN